MKRLRLTFLRLILTLSAATLTVVSIQRAEEAPTPGTGSIAIQHVTVIDVETGRRAADQTVIVTGNRIAAVGRATGVKTPAGAQLLDGTGKFLIPGLWEAHFHAIHLEYERTLPIAVARGITDARDMGAPIPYLLRARKSLSAGLLAPRMFVAGPELDGVASPALTQFFPPGEETIVTTPEEGRKMVDQLADLKVDFIKVHNELKRDVYYAVADEAKRKGLMFVGHLPPDVGIVEASDAGQKTIEHMNGLQAACAANPADLRPARNAPVPSEPIQIDQAKCEDAARRLARNGTFFSPTPIGAPGQGPKRVREFNLKIVGMASKAGVRLLAGTDWPGPGYAKGNYSTFDRTPQDELAGFVEAGLTPLEALRTATVNPAILFNRTDQLGGVQVGKLADLVLLDADPLIDINNTRQVWAVVVNGRLVDAAERKKILDAEAARRAEATRSNEAGK
jgi:imidazolonepropionase-like amidohydrolase